MHNTNDILPQLKQLPKEILMLIVLHLMHDGKLTFHDVAEVHIRHLEELRAGQSDKYRQLQNLILDMWHSPKKNRDKGLKDIMHHLVNEGRLNMTHNQIENRRGCKNTDV